MDGVYYFGNDLLFLYLRCPFVISTVAHLYT